MRGEEWQVAETLAASITVRGNRFDVDLEAFRGRERELLDRWIENRSHAHRITGEQIHDPRFVETFNEPG